jgi:hypothetical protein
MKITPALVFWVLLIIAVFMYCSGCSPSPCWCSDADGEYESVVEEPQTLFGSHDFFLEGEDKVTSSLLATKCQTCGIYFTHPSYGEHIKTCCP